ncbi:acyltransferase family protein [Mesorhizobium sp. B2-8-5]|uniref:acyltransferase family protein n=1 Tax=Mesorhizobium sp. B2-8-5 TaxID=2589903 RepID=UPI0015E331A6|nr:acyltransferase [Mesorhizobium sp. B2-8-5]UCI23673.1 acyltransferase [Mesorhizobium sp. B2-8-5]
MTSGLSTYLNGVRALAALIVLFIHISGNLSIGDIKLVTIGLHHDAVTIFFVLSGFVVAYAASERDGDALTFTINRFARIASVALPAIALTIAIDLWFTRIGSLDPATMAQLDNIPRYALSCATMTGFVWMANDYCFSNGPYWSLAYEVWFYVAFGVAFFAPTKTLKILGTFAVLAVMGPKMIILMPCWLLGVLIYRASGHRAPKAIGWFLLLAPLPIYIWLKQFDLNTTLAVNVASPFEIATGYRWQASGGFAYDWIIAALMAANVYGACCVFRGGAPEPVKAVASYFAGISFSIYLYQSPLFILFGTLIPPSSQGWHRAITLGVLTLYTCAALARITEARKDNLRAAIRRIVAFPSLVSKQRA